MISCNPAPLNTKYGYVQDEKSTGTPTPSFFISTKAIIRRKIPSLAPNLMLVARNEIAAALRVIRTQPVGVTEQVNKAPDE